MAFHPPPLSGALYPIYPPLMRRFTCAEACLRLLQLELALQEYHAEHAAYPERLSYLGTGPASTVLVDPFSERALIYRRRGAGYLLYSVGSDGKDDGGTPLPSSNLRAETRGDLVAGQLTILAYHFDRRPGSFPWRPGPPGNTL